MTGGREEKYRLCVIGFAHMHVNELVERFLETGRMELVACADTVPSTASRTQVEGSRHGNLHRALAKPGGPRAYDDYRTLLREERLDLAIFCPEISRHAEVAEAIAASGLHMVTEKPLAGRLVDARRVVQAAKGAGVRGRLNWPTTWRSPIRKVKELLDAQAIGVVWEVKWRNRASEGPLAFGSLHPGRTVVSGEVSEPDKAAEWWYQAEEGGGALLDYCCYGVCLSSWYLDAQATSVQSLTANLFSGFGNVEDNAALLLRYPAAIALLEASWTTLHNGVPNGPIIYGTRGTIVVDGDQVLVYETRDATPTQVLTSDVLPAGRSGIAEEFLHHLETGEPLHPTLDVPLNLATVAVLDAGLRSAASGRAETVDITG